MAYEKGLRWSAAVLSQDVVAGLLQLRADQDKTIQGAGETPERDIVMRREIRRVKEVVRPRFCGCAHMNMHTYLYAEGNFMFPLTPVDSIQHAQRRNTLLHRQIHSSWTHHCRHIMGP